MSKIKKTLESTKSHVVSAHAIDPGRVVAGILPLAAPATPAGAQLDNAMSARRRGDRGAQVEPGFSVVLRVTKKETREIHA